MARSLDRTAFLGAMRAASSTPRGVVYVGLDRFRGINALLGQTKGDAVLDIIEQRISAAFDDRVAVTRVRGSDFAVLIANCVDRAAVRAEAGRLRDRLTGWLRVDGDRVNVMVTAGVAWSDDDGSIDLLEEAYLSSRQEKWQRAAVSGDQPSRDDGILADELRRAIDAGQLCLQYQPQIDARSGLLLTVEALVRWDHPSHGLLGPHAFLPLAEDSGLMEPLGDWVIDQAARQARAWLDGFGGRGIPIGVNLSASQVGQGERIARVLGAALARYSLDGASLVVEVTESSLVTDLPVAARTLGAIRSLGIGVSLDDFGTGYSSLSYLRQLPVSTVKIDRSFVTGVDGSLADAVIVEAVTRLAHTLGLTVVAEGVEMRSQAEALIELDVDELQGYYFSRPLDVDAVDAATVAATWWTRDPPRNAPDQEHLSVAVPMPGGPRARLLMTRAIDAAPAPVLVVSRAHGDIGVVQHANPAFEALTGFVSADWNGRPFSELIEDSSADRAASERVLRSFTESSPAMVRSRVRSKSGAGIPVAFDATLVDDERGTSAYWIVTLRDLRTEGAADEHDRLAWLVENADALIAFAELDGRVTFMNSAGQSLTGWAAGCSLDDVISFAGVDVGAALEAAGRWSGELSLRRPNGEAPAPAWVDIMLRTDAKDPSRRSLAVLARPLLVGEVPDPSGDSTGDGPAVPGPPLDGSDTAAQRRARLQQLAIDVAQRGLDLGPLDFVAELSRFLSEVAVELKVDIAYADAFDDVSGHAVELGTFVRGGLIGAAPQGPELSRLPAWLAAINATDVLVVNDALLEDHAWWHEKAEVFNKVCRAMISVPLRARGRLLGAMSVEMVDLPRQWDADEIAFVRQVAHAIATLLESARNQEEHDRTRAQLSTALEHSFEGVTMLDAQGIVTYVNRAAGDVVGLLPADIIGRNFAEFLAPEDLDSARDLLERSADGPALGLVRIRRGEDQVVWMEASVTRLVDRQFEGFVSNSRDVTGRVLADASFARRASFDELAAGVAQRALDLGPTAFVERLDDVTEALGLLLRTDMCFVDLVENGYLHNVAGWAAPGQPNNAVATEPVPIDTIPEWRDHLLGLRPLVVESITSPGFLAPEAQPRATVSRTAFIAYPLAAHGELFGVLCVSMTSGDRRWNHDETALVHAIAVTIGSVLQWHRADGMLRESEERLQRLVRIDGLTGLANRLALREMLDAIESGDCDETPVAVMVIDLDRFKEANDRHGHDVGDDVLCRLAARFESIVPDHALLARTGGDEFVLIAPGIDRDAAPALAERLVAAADAPVEAVEESFTIGASVGIAIVPSGAQLVRDTLRVADRAMYEAKRLGGRGWHLGP